MQDCVKQPYLSTSILHLDATSLALGILDCIRQSRRPVTRSLLRSRHSPWLADTCYASVSASRITSPKKIYFNLNLPSRRDSIDCCLETHILLYIGQASFDSELLHATNLTSTHVVLASTTQATSIARTPQAQKTPQWGEKYSSTTSYRPQEELRFIKIV